jgi:hypothetical protein
MKYYETSYEEYIRSSRKYDIHPEIAPIIQNIPLQIDACPNMILYGPSGVGKYTVALRILERFSPSKLKHFKHMMIHSASNTTTSSVKNVDWTIRISDVHYEVDFSLLGCEPKKVWNDTFFQIVDVVSMSKEKAGIILCKNFHTIHNELLEVFYSYIQHCRLLNFRIVFFFLTEHVSFIPSNIVECSQVLAVSRPKDDAYLRLAEQGATVQHSGSKLTKFENRISRIGITDGRLKSNARENMRLLSKESIMNLKETQYLGLVDTPEQLPKELFNIVCDSIVEQMDEACNKSELMDYAKFRNHLYDILLYGLDITECIWYILKHYVDSGQLNETMLGDIMPRMHTFLKYYNNNYRPIYHLESIFVYLITHIYFNPCNPNGRLTESSNSTQPTISLSTK